MTHLILSVIGIFLASGAALVVMSYGGDYFIDAKNDAHAMDIENGFTNVLAAIRVHETKLGASPSAISDMLPGSGSGTLDVAPKFGDSVLVDSFQTLTIDGNAERAMIMNRVPDDVCLSINLRLGYSSIQTNPTGSYGCYWTGSNHTAFKTI